MKLDSWQLEEASTVAKKLDQEMTELRTYQETQKKQIETTILKVSLLLRFFIFYP